jgi:hypothetical protein
MVYQRLAEGVWKRLMGVSEVLSMLRAARGDKGYRIWLELELESRPLYLTPVESCAKTGP